MDQNTTPEQNQAGVAFTIDGLTQLEQMHDDAVFYVVLNNSDYKVTAKQFKDLILNNLPPAELPEGLVNEEGLTARLGDYLTSAQIAEAIRASIEEIPQISLPEDLVRESDLESINAELVLLKQAGYVSLDQLSEAFQNFVPALPVDVVRTTQLQAVETRVLALEQKPVVSPEEMALAIQAAKSDPDDAITRREVVELINAIEHPEAEGGVLPGVALLGDLDPLKARLDTLEQKPTVSPAELTQAIQAIPAPTIPEDVLRADDLEDVSARLVILEQKPVVSPTEMAQAIQAIPAYQLPDTVVHAEHLTPLNQGIQGLDQRLQTQEARQTVSPVELAQAIQAVPQYTLPESVVHQEELSILADKHNQLVAQVAEQVERPLVEQDELTQAVATVQALIPTDVAPGIQTAQDIQGLDQRVTVLEETDFVTVEVAQQMIRDIPAVQMPSNMATTEQLAAAQQEVGVLAERVLELEEKPFVEQDQLSAALRAVEEQIPVVPTNLATTQELDRLTQRTVDFETRLNTQENRATVSPQEAQQIAQTIVAGIPPYQLPSDVVRTTQLEAVDQKVVAFEETFDTTLENLSQNIVALHENLGLKLTAPAQAVAGAILAFTDEGLVQIAQQNGRVYHVNGATTNTREDGSVFAPFKTIQRALDTVPASSVIQLAPGSYRENLNPKLRSNLLIQGHGCIDSILTEIVGTVTVGGAGYEAVTRFRMKDVTLKNGATDQSPLVFAGSAGRHYFHNVTIEPIANTTAPAVQVIGASSNWIDFYNCNVGGEILLDGEPVAGASFTMRHPGHAKTKVNIKKEFGVIIHGCTRFGHINHEAGQLSVSHCIGFVGENGVAITSTSDTGGLGIQFSSMLTLDGMSILKIEKTGICSALLGQNIRGTEDTLSGPVSEL